jgi:hypothetical protein
MSNWRYQPGNVINEYNFLFTQKLQLAISLPQLLDSKEFRLTKHTDSHKQYVYKLDQG